MREIYWYNKLKKSPFNPPDYIFKTVWPILYFLMAASLAIVWFNKKCFPYCSAVTFFCIQLAFNLIWTTLFFKQRSPRLALLDMGVIILFTMLTYKNFKKINKFASQLLIPYIMWLFFALYLNLYIVINN